MTSLPQQERENPETLIIGAGFGGLAAGVALKERGYGDFIIAESEDALGGVWRDNRYPNAACDTPVDCYTFEFHQKIEWSTNFAPWNELLEYAGDIATRFGLREHIRFSTLITAARWDDDRQRWNVETADGQRWSPRFVIWAGGRLSRPAIPDLPGRELFKGQIFHTARWPDEVDLDDKVVAVVGGGATSIQVIPYVAEHTAHYYAFIRTPPYVLAKPEEFYDEERWQQFRDDPSLLADSRQKWAEFLEDLADSRFPMRDEIVAVQEQQWREIIEAEIKDPELLEALTPKYRLGCRRHSYSNDYYSSLAQPNATVISAGLAGLTADGVIADDGRQMNVDIVVLATGFEVNKMLGGLKVEGRGGTDLDQQWEAGQEAYIGVLVKNFPNLFLVDGPNSELSSATITIESHARYIATCVAKLAEAGATSLEVRADAQKRFNERVNAAMNGSVMVRGNCHSWHKVGGTGRVFTHWPGSPSNLRSELAEPLMDDLILRNLNGIL